jgi:hypothetical protein
MRDEPSFEQPFFQELLLSYLYLILVKVHNYYTDLF